MHNRLEEFLGVATAFVMSVTPVAEAAKPSAFSPLQEPWPGNTLVMDEPPSYGGNFIYENKETEPQSNLAFIELGKNVKWTDLARDAKRLGVKIKFVFPGEENAGRTLLIGNNLCVKAPDAGPVYQIFLPAIVDLPPSRYDLQANEIKAKDMKILK